MRMFVGKKWLNILTVGIVIGAIGAQEVSGAEISTQMKKQGNQTQILVNLQNPNAADPVRLSFIHLVKPGDTAWSIAKKYGVTVKELVERNQLDISKPLSVNQRIDIPVDQPIGAQPANEWVHVYLVVDELKHATNANRKTHLVKPGETLFSIAQSYQITMKQLMEKNGLGTSQQIIKIGQALQIPEKKQTAAKKYTVKPGDTLSHIARTHNTSLDKLLSLNALGKQDPILIGQQLNIPS